MSPLATFDDVSFDYGDRPVLRHVTSVVAERELVALVGPNGAGKSSLIGLAAGLLSPTSGAILIRGRPIAAYSPDALAREVAYLPQARSIHWPMAVRAIVALGRLPHQGRRYDAAIASADAAAIDTAIAAMGIAVLADRPVLALSGGEQARVLMARALAQDTPLLLADEPTAGLDPGHQLDLMQCLRTRADAGAASLVATHDLSLAARFADRVILMADGQIVAAGPPAEVLTEARLSAAYGVSLAVGHVDGMPVFVPRRAPDIPATPPVCF